MSIKLSIISGKGGCGKTTLALSLSQMLSMAGLNVLLIDCDTSTHGASYFFENVLKKKSRILTVADLFSDGSLSAIKQKKPIGVKKNIDFIPSSVYLSDDSNNDFDVEIDELVLEPFFKNYDAVIFDCQSGYTHLMKNIVRISDKNLMVLELDAVSTSATRALISQLGTLLGSANTYQVFNKMTGEDFEVYKYVTHGTFFRNLTPIKYDLSIRKAFAFNSLPRIDIEPTDFSNAIFQLAYELFLEIRNKLIKIIVERKEKIRKELILEYEYLFESKKNSFKYFLKKNIHKVLMVILGAVFAICFSILGFTFEYEEIISSIAYFLVGVASGLTFYKFLELIDELEELKSPEVDEKILEIEQKIETIEVFIEENQNFTEDEVDSYNYEDVRSYIEY